MFALVTASCGEKEDHQTEENHQTEGKEDHQVEGKKAYALLEEAEMICLEGMEDIYATWYFGIYKLDDVAVSKVFEELSEITSFDESFLKKHADYSGENLVNGTVDYAAWNCCLFAIENCLSARGDYSDLDVLLAEAKTAIQALPDEYDYKDELKNYYNKLASYAGFFENITGSFNDLKTTMSDYERGIREAKEVLRFDFES